MVNSQRDLKNTLIIVVNIYIYLEFHVDSTQRTLRYSLRKTIMRKLVYRVFNMVEI